jgi:hypothetical protein
VKTKLERSIVRLLVMAAVVLILSVFLAGCASRPVDFSRYRDTGYTVQTYHRTPPIIDPTGLQVRAYSIYNAKLRHCTIVLPWPNKNNWENYMYLRGHEDAHCDFESWHEEPEYAEAGDK